MLTIDDLRLSELIVDWAEFASVSIRQSIQTVGNQKSSTIVNRPI
jgi:hypothetical protein